MATVIIDIGHWGCDSGAVCGKYNESQLNYAISHKVQEALVRNGIEVIFTSGTLQNRTSIENRLNSNKKNTVKCFVSIHNNAGGGDGTEIYTYPTVDANTKELAKMVYEQIVPKLNNGRGIKTANYHVLRETICSAILIECAFIDTEDIAAVNEEHEFKAWGEAIAKGICNWLAIPFKTETETPVVPTTGNKYYRVQLGAFSHKENAEKLKEDLYKLGYNAIIKYE